MKKFVLVGTQRSGTTFIRHCLNSHDNILCHGELLFRNYPDEEGYFKRKQKLFAGSVRHMLLRKSMLKNYLDNYYSHPGYEAIGFKLMYSQARWLPYSFPYALTYIKNNSLSVIHVIRENVLKTYLSREIAIRRKLYHAKSKPDIKKIDLDTTTLLKNLKKIKSENDWWRNNFSQENYLALSYESFVSNKEQESRRLLEFLGIAEYQELVSSNVKIASDNLSDVIENYTQVVECLASTEFAYCLDVSDQTV